MPLDETISKFISERQGGSFIVKIDASDFLICKVNWILLIVRPALLPTDFDLRLYSFSPYDCLRMGTSLKEVSQKGWM